MAEPDYQEIRRTPATVWQALTTDYDSLVTSYDWRFSMDWEDDPLRKAIRREGMVRRRWTYKTYILYNNGARYGLGDHDDRITALRFHEEMVVKHGFF